VILVLMRAAQPHCYVMLTILAWGTFFGLRDYDINETGTAPLSRDADATDMRHSFGVTLC
jgi:hypothetical protein